MAAYCAAATLHVRLVHVCIIGANLSLHTPKDGWDSEFEIWDV